MESNRNKPAYEPLGAVASANPLLCLCYPGKRVWKVALLLGILATAVFIYNVQTFVFLMPLGANGGHKLRLICPLLHNDSVTVFAHNDTETVFAHNDTETVFASPIAAPKATRSLAGCSPVLVRATYGEWIPKNHTDRQKQDVLTFIERTRRFHKLPPSLQRKDNRCGDTNLVEGKSTAGLSWYKAMCDPTGKTPCCHSSHTCKNLTEVECRCPGCQDMRRPVHAELSTWRPFDSTCKLSVYDGESSVCSVLRNMTIHVVGDSYMRQLYTSLLGTLRSGHPDGIFKDSSAPRDKIEECDRYYRYFSDCRFQIPHNVSECQNTVHFHWSALWGSYQVPQILDVFKNYSCKPNTFVVFGLGIHDMYRTSRVVSKILNPLLQLLESLGPWPRLIWVAPQVPGLLKTPLVKEQSPQSVSRYNSIVSPLMKSKGIPVLDGFNLTKDGVVSYDGTHYGKGLNDVKAQVLFNYFNEIRPSLGLP